MKTYSENPIMDNDPSSPHRGTGRTTKQIMEAMQIVCDRPVLYVCVNVAQYEMLCECYHAVRGFGPLLADDDEDLRAKLRGRDGVVIVDHACPDSFREIAKEVSR